MRAFVLACAFIVMAVAASAPSGEGASSTLDVTFGVGSMTAINSGGCPSQTPGVTDFGVVQPGTSMVQPGLCTVEFGSNNDTSMLRLFQLDQGGTAMHRVGTAGALDPTFDGDGQVYFNGSGTSGGTMRFNDVVVQGDGKLVAVGGMMVGDEWRAVALRFNADGSIDASYGASGIAVMSPGGVDWVAMAVALQADGKAVVGGLVDGSYSTGGSGKHTFIGRLTTGGVLDTGFNTTGVRTISFSGAGADHLNDVALAPDGSIFGAGYAGNGGLMVVKLTASGALDTTFDVDGKVEYDYGASTDRAGGIRIQSDGKPVVAGELRTYPEGDAVLVRFTTTGALDPTFGGDGIVGFATASTNEWLTDLAIGAGGVITASGFDFANVLAVRVSSAGVPDVGFDGDGIAAPAATTNLYSGRVAIALDGSGQPVLVGWTSTTQHLAVRLTTSGALDPAFSGDGLAPLDVGSGIDYGLGAAIDGTGRIVMAGFASDGGYTKATLARLQANGTPDATFDGDGIVLKSSGGNSAWMIFHDAFVMDDQRIVAVGQTDDGLSEHWVAARFLPTGALDTTFGEGGGLVFNPLPGDSMRGAAAVTVDGAGRPIIVGTPYLGSSSAAVVRLTVDGAYDTAFGGGDGIFIDTAHEFHDVRIDGASRIVVGGENSAGQNSVVRLTPSGVLDTSFSGDGRASLTLAGSDTIRSVWIQQNGAILVAGLNSNGDQAGFVGRFTDTGVADATFGTGGSVVLNPSIGARDIAHEVRQLDSGDILVIGELAGVGGARLTSAGVLDLTYDGDGYTNSGLNGSPNSALGGGAIMSNGSFYVTDETFSPGILRFTSTGVLDAEFDGDGRVTIGYMSDIALDIAERPVAAGGGFRNGNLSSNAGRGMLVRLGGGAPIADYDDPANADWGTAGAALFGVCLDAVGGGATPVWAVDPDTCTATDADPWRGIVTSPAAPGAKVATSALGNTTASVSVRFGVRPAAAQQPGRYVAALGFEVVAPEV